jgi:Sulfotransferase family
MTLAQEKLTAGRKFDGPLFVIGMWRSGTSLLYALLNQHPQIALLYEGDLPLLWPLFLRGRAKQDWPERWQFWNSGPERHRLQLEDLPRRVVGLSEACLAAWKQYAGSAIGGCKSPNYFDMLPELGAQFPQARFIVIWRKPVEICRSIVRAGATDSFFAQRGMILRALWGLYDMRMGIKGLRRKGMSIFEIDYDTLVNDPESVTAGVCRLLELPHHPGMLSLQHADRSAIYEGFHHDMVKSEQIKAKKEEQEEVLSSRLVRKIERYTAFLEAQTGRQLAVHDNGASAPKAWFVLERFVDRVMYRMFRMFDQAVAFIYCFAPLWLLRKYRAAKARRATAVVSNETLAGASLKD